MNYVGILRFAIKWNMTYVVEIVRIRGIVELLDAIDKVVSF